jgi:hypothetical protein
MPADYSLMAAINQQLTEYFGWQSPNLLFINAHDFWREPCLS